MIKVSVVVPVYNPGNYIDDCIRSLLDQSLPTDEYEVFFVDDGSTDDTPARLDKLAAEHDHVNVIHMPNSGWPGRPRNVGMDAASGEYVYFVDNDDYLGHEALERLYAMAVADDADVVVGKVVSNGKQVPRVLFHINRHAESLERSPFLLALLSPHKLFRRSFLAEHDIRFPEGRRRLEDHVFVVHAFLHTERISVLSDYPCYYWIVRDDKTNASIGRFDPAAYYGNVREVLDLVERHTEPGESRQQLLAHWYRGKILKRVRAGNFLRHDPEYRHELYTEIRKIAVERYGDWVDDHLGFAQRMRSYLLRHRDETAVIAMAAFERQLRPVATGALVEDGDNIAVRVEARMSADDTPLRFVRHGERILWAPPPDLASCLPDDVRDATADNAEPAIQVLLRSRKDGATFLVASTTQTRLDPTDDAQGGLTMIAFTQVAIDPANAAAGAALRPGAWAVTAVVNFAGFYDELVVKDADGRRLRFRVRQDATAKILRPGSGINGPDRHEERLAGGGESPSDADRSPGDGAARLT